MHPPPRVFHWHLKIASRHALGTLIACFSASSRSCEAVYNCISPIVWLRICHMVGVSLMLSFFLSFFLCYRLFSVISLRAHILFSFCLSVCLSVCLCALRPSFAGLQFDHLLFHVRQLTGPLCGLQNLCQCLEIGSGVSCRLPLLQDNQRIIAEEQFKQQLRVRREGLADVTNANRHTLQGLFSTFATFTGFILVFVYHELQAGRYRQSA